MKDENIIVKAAVSGETDNIQHGGGYYGGKYDGIYQHGPFDMDRVEKLLRENPQIRNVNRKRSGGITFEKQAHSSSDGTFHILYEIHFYPDIHKITAKARPLPRIHSNSEISRWYLKEQNLDYQRRYGISVQYDLQGSNIALTGETEIKRNPEQDLRSLIKVMDHCLSGDFPKVLDIYFGVIPGSIRKSLTGQMNAYRKELEEAD